MDPASQRKSLAQKHSWCEMNDLKEQKVKDESGSLRETSQSPMMLMMVICCGLPLLLFVVLPLVGLKFAVDNISWGVIGLIAVVACVAMMMFRHRKA